MEKRFALFLILSALILFTHLTVQNFLHPPQAEQPPAEVAEAGQDQAKPKPEPAKKGPDAAACGQAGKTTGPSRCQATRRSPGAGPCQRRTNRRCRAAARRGPEEVGHVGFDGSRQPLPADGHAATTPARPSNESSWSSGPARASFAFWIWNRTAGTWDTWPSKTPPDGKGCRVNVVGPGTPAAGAKAQSPGAGDGLRAGDVIRRIDSAPVRDAIDLERYLAGTKPGQTVQIAVVRTAADGGRPKEEILTATLASPPLSIVRPDGQFAPVARSGRFAVLPVHAGKHRRHVHPARRGGNRHGQAAQSAGQQLGGSDAGGRPAGPGCRIHLRPVRGASESRRHGRIAWNW